GAPIALDLGRAGRPGIRLFGRVVRPVPPEQAFLAHVPPGMAIEFVEPPAAAMAHLRDLLASLTANPQALDGDARAPERVTPSTEEDASRLKVQVTGLLLEVSEWRSKA